MIEGAESGASDECAGVTTGRSVEVVDGAGRKEDGSDK